MNFLWVWKARTGWKPRSALIRFGFWKDLRVGCSGENGLERVGEEDWQGGGFQGPEGTEVHQPTGSCCEAPGHPVPFYGPLSPHLEDWGRVLLRPQPWDVNVTDKFPIQGHRCSASRGSHVCKEQSLAPNTGVHGIHEPQYHPTWRAQRRHGDRTLQWVATCARAGPAGRWPWVGVEEPRTLRQPQAAGGAAALA